MLTFYAVKPCCLSALLLATATMITPAHAANVCDAVYQASIKSIQMPSHSYNVVTMEGKATVGEGISAGGAEYLKVDGQWRRFESSQQDRLEKAQEKLKTHPDTCVMAGNQSKDGQATTLYKVHNTEMGADTQVWIAQSSGLPVHVTAKLGTGNTTDSRIDYSNVQPPAGVK